jgi:transcription initiation factor TFIID subunit 5
LRVCASNPVSTDKPGQSSVDHDLGTGIAGLGDNSLALFNEQPVSLGKLPPDLAFLAEVERCLDAENPETIEDLQLLKLKVQQALQTPFDPNSPARETVPFPPKYPHLIQKIL